MATDWTAPDSPAPMSDDELEEAAYQFYRLRLRIRGAEPPSAVTVPRLNPPDNSDGV